tara:strand:+ start:333 stop:617 length:285 start_codon:yes stop_codon:yes gene_type:complete
MINKVTTITIIIFSVIGFIGKANAGKHSKGMGKGVVYNSCVDNIKTMNIYREDVSYRQIYLEDALGHLTCNGSRVVKKGYSVTKEISDLFYLNF